MCGGLPLQAPSPHPEATGRPGPITVKPLQVLPCTLLGIWLPAPRTQESPHLFWLKPGLFKARLGPGVVATKNSSRNVKHTNDLRNCICTSSTQNRLGYVHQEGRSKTSTGMNTHTHLLEGRRLGSICPHAGADAYTLILVSSIRSLHRIFTEPVQNIF